MTRIAGILLLILFFDGVIAQQRGIFHRETGQDLTEISQQLMGMSALFQDEKPLELEIIADFKTITENVDSLNYHDAWYKYRLNDTLQIVNNFRIKLRGEFRRKACDRPPIKLNFKKTELFTNEFDHIKSLKLVSKCDDNRISQEYIFREYLAYKLLNQITDQSFKVRLVQIKFVDTGKKYRSRREYGFIIEPVKSLAKRTGSKEFKKKILVQDSTERQQLDRVTTFQFMIGNTDWSIPGGHNTKIFKPKTGRPFIVPYDFDFSGLVNADYAFPYDHLDLNNVRERLFRGLCRSAEEMEDTFERFREKERDIYQEINNFRLASKSSRKYMNSYIEGFFKIINDPGEAQKSFSVNCTSFTN